jgi:glycogen operon protein
VARLIALRRQHPVLRHPHFLHGRLNPAPGIADIAWFDQSGAVIPAEAWNDVEQRTLILRRAIQVDERTVTILSLLLNPGERPCDFRLPAPHLSGRVLLDTSDLEVRGHLADGDGVSVAAHSAVLLYSELST